VDPVDPDPDSDPDPQHWCSGCTKSTTLLCTGTACRCASCTALPAECQWAGGPYAGTLLLYAQEIAMNRIWTQRYRSSREMENISRGPSFGDFVTILTERSMQDLTLERSQVIFAAVTRNYTLALNCHLPVMPPGGATRFDCDKGLPSPPSPLFNITPHLFSPHLCSG
jgi:hypothetical protein